MKWSKNRLYGAILVLGSLALVADRYWFGRQPVAAIADVQLVEAAAAAAVGGVEDDWIIPEVPFPINLPASGDGTGARDPFSTLDGKVVSAGDGDAASASEPEMAIAQQLADGYVLEGTYLDGSRRSAVVNGRIMRQGDRTKEDCELIEIGDTWVRFRCPDGLAELRLYQN